MHIFGCLVVVVVVGGKGDAKRELIKEKTILWSDEDNLDDVVISDHSPFEQMGLRPIQSTGCRAGPDMGQNIQIQYLHTIRRRKIPIVSYVVAFHGHKHGFERGV